MQYSRSLLAACAAAMWVVAAGCSGEISVRSDDPGGSSAATGTGPNGGSHVGPDGTQILPGDPGPNGSGPGGALSPSDGPIPTEIGPAPATRTARLTHAQWENSVRDLFGLPQGTHFASSLRADPVQSGFLFDNNALTMSVDGALWSGYQQAAADVAEFVTSDATRLAAIAPQGTGDIEARAQQLVRDFGLRSYRRPLSDAEVSEYVALFRKGPELYDGLTEFTAGARVLIEAMLQAPNFLYRVEASERTVDGTIPLSSYEVATRLSYTLWNTMPDAELFEAAAADALRDPDQVATQAQRMLDDPRAQSMVTHFHDQLFEVERFASIRPSSSRFPDLPSDFGESAAIEQRRFVADLVLDERGNYTGMLTGNETFVNADLAEVYGLSGDFGDEFEKVALDPQQRSGILTHIGFLALHATSVNPDPIHRGVFLARRITCANIAAPPADIPPLPEAQGRTNRETIEDHTQKPGTVCASCHATMINPLGFPFENFDAIGRLRTTDNGHAVDTRSEAFTGRERVPVADSVELSEALSESRAVHECYAQHWLEFAYGRPKTNQDVPLIAKLGEQSLNEGLPIADMVVALVTSTAFLNRSAQELP